MPRRLSYIEIENGLSAASDDKEIASELKDHISSISESSSEEETGTTGSSEYYSRPNMNATSQITDECSAVLLFFTKDIESIILISSNVEGVRVYGNEWKTIDSVKLGAYIRLLHAMNQQKAFGMQKKHVLRFNSRETRSSRKQNDKFAAVRDLWDIWVETLPKFFNPSAFVTVDEQLGLRVVLDLSYGLKGHITFDNFFTSCEVGQMLLNRNVTMIGTIRKNKPSIPTELLNTKNKE
ncbi:hypothetical protein PR048_010635, partial [Dryococelus australis]